VSATWLKILFLEDNPLDVDLAIVALKQAGIDCDYDRVDTRQEFIESLDDSLDIILADYTLPQYDALEALNDLKEKGLDIPVVIITGTISEEVAVECIKQGAADYLLKDRLTRLGPAINQVLEEKKLRQAKAQAEQELIVSEERYRFLAEFSPDAIILYFGDKISYINQAGIDILGASNQEQLIGLTSKGFVHPDEHHLVDERDALLYQGESTESATFTVNRLDGKKISIDVKTSPINLYNEKGEQAFLSVFRDVTERIQRQKELEAIATISEALRMAASLPEMVPVTLDQIMTMLDLTGVGIIFFDPDNEVSTFDAGRGVWEDIGPIPVKSNKGIVGQVYQTSQTYVRNAGDQDDTLFEDVHKDLAMMVSSLAVIPLIAQDETIGVIVIGKDTDIIEDDIRMLKAIGDITGSALQRAILEEDLEANFVETVLALANALELRHTQTADHSQKMAVWAQDTLRILGGSDTDLRNVRLAALLHDIGKIGMPDDILQKEDKLSSEEWEVVRKHPEIGAEVVAPIQKLAEVAPIIRAHQEKFDGSGYPFGLKGEEIPLTARVIGVVDAYCAMTEDRVYRPARGKEEAIEELKNCEGTDFDPQVIEAFLRMMKEAGEI
jgi:PAS domain S-box-containing protein/putative nucleotidyltransferase with HDIG domain